jgi:hypothetical protein
VEERGGRGPTTTAPGRTKQLALQWREERRERRAEGFPILHVKLESLPQRGVMKMMFNVGLHVSMVGI